MSKASFTGTVSMLAVGFGVKAYAVSPTTFKEEIKLHVIHKECLSEVSQQLVCKKCNQVVPKEQQSKGFRWDPDAPASEQKPANQQMYVVEEHEIENAIPEAEEGRPIIVQKIVSPKEIDTLWHERSFYLTPVTPHDAETYSLFSRALRDEKGVAIVTYTANRSTHLGMLQPGTQGIVLETLHYREEMRTLADLGLEVVDSKHTRKEIEQARQIVHRLKDRLHYEAYRNEGREKFKLLVQAKIEQRPYAPGPPISAPASNNLVEALEQSLKMLKDRKKKAS